MMAKSGDGTYNFHLKTKTQKSATRNIQKQTTVTMRTSAISIATMCLVASLSLATTNAFMVQPRSVPALSVKPTVVTKMVHVASKRPKQKNLVGRRIIIQTEADAGAIVGVDCDARCDAESSELYTTDNPVASNWKRTIKLTTLFFMWYVLNVAYNIGNKRVLNALPLPWTTAAAELFFGFPYVALLWTTGLRKRPKLSLDNVKTLTSKSFFLGVTHVLGVISFGVSAISLTHILKATEPVWAALLVFAGFKGILPVPVSLSLLPIIGSVGLFSMKELSFSWVAFVTGTLSAVTSATKVILSKKLLDGKPLGLTPTNILAVLTILGFLCILPVSLLVEGPAKVSAAWAAALARGYTTTQLLWLLSLSGSLYYIYNEVAFLALSEVAPVTPAVANTAKLVVIILFCSFLSHPRQQARADRIAIDGAMVYSMSVRSHRERTTD
jgi:solute carrier family 35 protein E1